MKIAYNISLKDKSKKVTYCLHAILEKKNINFCEIDSPYFVTFDFINNSLNKKNKNTK
jgi:hypothetical protein